MPQRIADLLDANRRFVAERTAHDPLYFAHLAEGQHPQFLWIGCSDSRVSPNLITGTEPGDMFVHRNIANLVVQTDLNLLSVLQYAVQVLRVPHVIVCGHYGCGGVHAALGDMPHGLIDNWLRTIRDTRQFHARALAALDEDVRARRLVELNVVEQVWNLGKTSIVEQAWRDGLAVALHGWVFDLASGRIAVQTPPVQGPAGVDAICKFARMADA